MNRSPGLLCRCAALLLACLPARAQESRDTEKPLSATGPPPALPVSGVLDEGNVFGAEEETQLAGELENFRRRVGVPLYVVTANYISGGTVEEFSERLVSEALRESSGLVLLYERGSGQLNYSATPGALGRAEDMKLLFLAGSKAAASLPVTATTAQRLHAAVQALTVAGEQWKSSGTLPDPDAVPPPPLPVPVPETPAESESPPARETAPASAPLRQSAPSVMPPPAQRSVMAGLAAALLVGAALLFGFHRWQERFESRISAQYHFPDVRVGRRLGAPRGGGVIAAISFKEKR